MAKDEDVEEDNLTACDECGEEFNEDDMTDVSGSILCDDCFNSETRDCEGCGSRYLTSDGYSGECDGDFCSSDCYWDTYRECDACGGHFSHDDITDGLCSDCYENDNDYYEFSPRFTFNRTDSTEKMDTKGFTIGIEMETINGDRVAKDDLEFKNEEEETIFFSRVGAKDDGSLSDGGVEFVTNPSSNDETYTTIKTVCDVLKRNKFTVDRTCGLHIHLGEKKGEVKRLTPINRHKIMILYGIYKDVMFRMVEGRRTGNSYCDSSRYYLCPELFKSKGARNPEELFDEIVRTRYSHINFESWVSHNTLEIRFHHGSVDFHEIKNWIDFHTRMFDFACASTYRDLLNLKANLFGVWRILSDKTLVNYYRQQVKKYRVVRGHFRKSKMVQNVVVPIMKRHKDLYSRDTVIRELVPLIEA